MERDKQSEKERVTMVSEQMQGRGVDAAAMEDRAGGLRREQTTNGRSNGNAAVGSDAERLARGLGWFSLGLGLAQIAAPEKIAEVIGLDPRYQSHAMLRAVGVREIASGIGLLTRSNRTPWLWARVGGDALDLAFLRSAMEAPGADRNRVAAATAAVLGVTVADALCGARLASEADGARVETEPAGSVPVTTAITVNAPVSQVYQAWAGFANLPRFMGDFSSVEVTNDTMSHWKATLPAGLSLDWDVQITESIENERIAWQTGEGSVVAASGQILFQPAPNESGTEIHFEAEFFPPGGELGTKIGGLFSDAIGVKVHNDLRRFKQLTEIGEIVASDDSVVPGPNPARPTPINAAA